MQKSTAVLARHLAKRNERRIVTGNAIVEVGGFVLVGRIVSLSSKRLLSVIDVCRS
jgi:hypothetical protein